MGTVPLIFGFISTCPRAWPTSGNGNRRTAGTVNASRPAAQTTAKTRLPAAQLHPIPPPGRGPAAWPGSQTAVRLRVCPGPRPPSRDTRPCHGPRQEPGSQTRSASEACDDVTSTHTSLAKASHTAKLKVRVGGAYGLPDGRGACPTLLRSPGRGCPRSPPRHWAAGLRIQRQWRQNKITERAGGVFPRNQRKRRARAARRRVQVVHCQRKRHTHRDNPRATRPLGTLIWAFAAFPIIRLTRVAAHARGAISLRKTLLRKVAPAPGPHIRVLPRLFHYAEQRKPKFC